MAWEAPTASVGPVDQEELEVQERAAQAKVVQAARALQLGPHGLQRGRAVWVQAASEARVQAASMAGAAVASAAVCIAAAVCIVAAGIEADIEVAAVDVDPTRA